ncbi:MAG: hypothetical protein GQ477_04945 [Nanohaloarchaea archaeon]|nr:hypothetical protein [Candidatus Nanohaloarchaea archaeon]
MSGYFITDPEEIEDIISFGHTYIGDTRISASVIKQGIFIRPLYEDTNEIEFDIETFQTLYEEYLNCFEIYKESVEIKHNMVLRRNTQRLKSEGLWGSSIRINEDTITFDHFDYTDEPVPFAYQYEVIKKNPVGLDNYCKDDIILSPDEVQDDDEYSFIHKGTINLRYTVPLENYELGKFISLTELKKIYENVMRLSGPIDS